MLILKIILVLLLKELKIRNFFYFLESKIDYSNVYAVIYKNIEFNEYNK